MQTRISNRPRTILAREGFSLVELLTAVSIMTVIIFALYSVFNQTQKALRSNITQVDVLEAGRTTAEMIGRDLETLAPSDVGQTINLYAGLPPAAVMPSPLVQLDTASASTISPVLRTNILQEFFFLSRQTNSWIGTGYRVLGAGDGVGTLYRFSVSTPYYDLPYTNLFARFMNTALTNPVTGLVSTNFHRLADGVVHLRLTAYDRDGRRLGWETTNVSPNLQVLRRNRSGVKLGLTSSPNIAIVGTNVILQQVSSQYAAAVNETQFQFLSNAVPGYIELELGVLEPTTYKQYQSLRDGPTRVSQTFLSKQAGKVHLFRQRIPIRTAQQ